MEMDNGIKQIKLAGPETVVELKGHPSMFYVFTKALFISMFRSNSIKDETAILKSRFIIKNFQFNKEIILNYKKICGFSKNEADIVPISYLQSLFIGLFGKYIISSYFPITPLGLIHTFQSFEQKRAIKNSESIDLSCSLIEVNKTQKGIETTFKLDVVSNDEIVWEGLSIFLTKTKKKKKKRLSKKEEIILEKKDTIDVPKGTGLKYAKVSGDYNPHHLYATLAKVFGFKKAIAHGMWSLGSVIASIDKTYPLDEKCKIEAFFKLPIFMPATTALGYEPEKNDQGNTIVHFELRDNQEGLPHLKGRVLL